MITITDITIPNKNNQPLNGLIIKNDTFSGKRPVILVFHGWNSEMARYTNRIKTLVEIGYTAVMFDMRGHGSSPGNLSQLSVQDHLHDCMAAYEYMISLPELDINNISIFGSSYGGYLGLLLSEKREIHHLSLIVPAQYPDSIFTEYKSQMSDKTMQYRKSSHMPENNMALHAMSVFTGDVLMIEADRDEWLPKVIMEDYRKAATNGEKTKKSFTYKFIPNSTHTLREPEAKKEVIKTTREWFARFLST